MNTIAALTEAEADNLRRVFGGDDFVTVPVASEMAAIEMACSRMAHNHLACSWHREDGQWFVTWTARTSTEA